AFQVHHFTDGKQILPQLDEFFAQHIARRAATPEPSLFHDELHRQFYLHVVRAAAEAGWLRFTRLDWQGRAIAFHFGFCYRGSFLWYKPSFAIEFARRSPSEGLLPCL